MLGVITSEQRTTGNRVGGNQRTEGLVRPSRARRKAPPALEGSGEDGQTHELAPPDSSHPNRA
jgi:hypothetical protein